MNTRNYYFTTRDLLIMAALAALGGVSSTYINLVGDFFQSFLGFAGTTQWAAGLHVLWLVLAVGLTKKAGTGTITGILKGGVELFSGNTHGLLILLVDLAAGILVDLGIAPFRKRDHWTAYALAGGLASASNVLVFQLFAAVPADILTFGLIGLIALVAFISGVIFAGILGAGLLATLRRSGVVKDQPAQPLGKKARWILLASTLLLLGGLFSYLKFARSGGEAVSITGGVANPYQFTPAAAGIEEQVLTTQVDGLSRSFRGYPLDEILAFAEPDEQADLVTLLAADGYSFFITFTELEENPGIVLQAQGKRGRMTFNVAGPVSKKAWVNDVTEIQIIRSAPLEVWIQGEQYLFTASEWVGHMDSAFLDLGAGSAKYQGVPLKTYVEDIAPVLNSSEVLAADARGNEISFSLQQIRDDDGIRIFINLSGGNLTYALAHLDGEVYLTDLEIITIP